MGTNNFGGRTYIVNETDRVEDVKSGPIVQNIPVAEPLDARLVDEWPVETPETTPQPLSDMVIEETPRGETIAFNNDNVGTIVTPEARAAELASATKALPLEPGALSPLLDVELSEIFRNRWNEVQARFVDEPRTAVQQADGLVTDVIVQITSGFANEHNVLESQWKQGSDVSTEDLRKALQRYRSFFNRLVI